MTEQYANQQFYEWEASQYGDNSPLSDEDRILWVKGYLQGVGHLFDKFCKPTGE